MPLTVRLARHGRKNRPHYTIVVADSRSPRDGKFIERVGTYNPLLAKDAPNRVTLNADRIKYWLSVGAQPSDRVAIFLGKAGLAPVPAQGNNPNKSKPKAKAVERERERAEKLAAAEEAANAPAPVEEVTEEAAAETPAEEAGAAEEAVSEEAAAEAPAEEAAPEAAAEAEAATEEQPS